MRTRIIFRTLGATLLATAALTIYLALTLTSVYRDLSNTTASLRETEQNLTLERTARNALQEDNNKLQVDLTDERTARNELQEDKNNLQVDLTNERASRDRLQQDLNGALVQAQGLQDQLSNSQAKTNRLQDQLNDSLAKTDRLENQLTNSQTEADQLQEQLEDSRIEAAHLARDYANLKDSVGQLEDLQQQVTELLQQREPLILNPGDTYRVGFRCTGSMEPVITCLDEATWLNDFRPEDITVGATISFNPGCREDQPSASSTAHRVKRVKVDNGLHYFWPRGDGNHEDDGCWVPETHVGAYIVDIHKNVRPENAQLRNNLNAADKALTDFQLRHCGRPTFANCTLSEPYYSWARSVLATYRCWLDNARKSEYPGHIPNTSCQSALTP